MIIARGRIFKRIEGMNSLEQKYADHLEIDKRKGIIELYRYEKITLRLADRTTYTPDFQVMFPDGKIQFHEVKGFMRDDANVKLKVAAEQFPEFQFTLVKWDKKKQYFYFKKVGEWDI